MKQAKPPKPEHSGKGPKLDILTLANAGTLFFFNSIAIATSHEHWLKEHGEVLDFTVPLVAWINQLPPKTLKKIESNVAPAACLFGFLSLVGPDLAKEIAIRNENRRSVNEAKAQGVNRSNPASRSGLQMGRQGQGGNGTGGEPPTAKQDAIASGAIRDEYDV